MEEKVLQRKGAGEKEGLTFARLLAERRTQWPFITNRLLSSPRVRKFEKLYLGYLVRIFEAPSLYEYKCIPSSLFHASVSCKCIFKPADSNTNIPLNDYRACIFNSIRNNIFTELNDWSIAIRFTISPIRNTYLARPAKIMIFTTSNYYASNQSQCAISGASKTKSIRNAFHGAIILAGKPFWDPGYPGTTNHGHKRECVAWQNLGVEIMWLIELNVLYLHLAGLASVGTGRQETLIRSPGRLSPRRFELKRIGLKFLSALVL